MPTSAAPKPTIDAEKIDAIQDDVKKLTLDERILLMMAEISVQATGRSPYSQAPAVSIGDIEDAVRPLLVKYRVSIRFSELGLTYAAEAKLWEASIMAHIRCAEKPPVEIQGEFDGYHDPWSDVGNNPAAAYSFARKSYLKAMFHIGDATDDSGTAAADHAQQASGNGAAAAPAALPPARKSSGGPVFKQVVIDAEAGEPVHCPNCSQGLQEYVLWDSGNAYLSCTNFRDCKWKGEPSPELDARMRARAQEIPF